MLYKYVYAGCRAGHYDTLTRTHTNLNLRVITRTQAHTHEKSIFTLRIAGTH